MSAEVSLTYHHAPLADSRWSKNTCWSQFKIPHSPVTKSKPLHFKKPPSGFQPPLPRFKMQGTQEAFPKVLFTHHHEQSSHTLLLPRIPPGPTSGSSVRGHTSICLDTHVAEGPGSCWCQLQLTSNFTRKKKLEFYHTQILCAQPAFIKNKRDSCCFMTAAPSNSGC